MRGVVLATAFVVGACWTGADTPVTEPAAIARRAEPPPARLRVRLERTPCFGFCPTYTVVIHGDGRVDWAGRTNVHAIGHRRGRVSRDEIAELSRMLDRARFFERNEYGELPAQPECTTTGSTTSCSFGTSVSICSDTSHAIISVNRGMQTHTVDNDHCAEQPELEAVEDFIDRIANTGAWIGQ
jgi:hypothetical protein